jgi:hypothetical protein
MTKKFGRFKCFFFFLCMPSKYIFFILTFKITKRAWH